MPKWSEGNQGVLLESFKGEGKGQKVLGKHHDFPLPNYQFPSGRITLPLGMMFSGKAGECICAATG